MADLVSECNVVSAVHSYVPVPVPVTVRMADLVSECNVVSAVHSDTVRRSAILTVTGVTGTGTYECTALTTLHSDTRSAILTVTGMLQVQGHTNVQH